MCDHIDTEETLDGNIHCCKCGKLVGRVATEAMAEAAFTFLREQRIGQGDSISNKEMRGLIDAAMAVQPIT
jgi:hypothetical protein